MIKGKKVKRMFHYLRKFKFSTVEPHVIPMILFSEHLNPSRCPSVDSLSFEKTKNKKKGWTCDTIKSTALTL